MSSTRSANNQQNICSHNIPFSARSTCHPSQQSFAKPFKPSIKVGYLNASGKQQETRRYRKPVMIIKHMPRDLGGVKKIQSEFVQAKSGAFVDSEYVATNRGKRQAETQRRGVAEVQSKVHGGREFSQQLKQQFVARSRSSKCLREASVAERSKLSGYRNEGIKDIIQYQHAGDYREAKLASKCTNQRAASRCVTYGELHDFDFRKLRQRLR